MPTPSNIICATCEHVLRPPFTMCGEEGDGLLCNNCCRSVDVIPGTLVAFVNKVLRNPLEQCQYGCGLRVNMVILAGHEQTCSLRTKCAFNWCQWLGGLSKLLEHVQFTHPARLVDLHPVRNNFRVQLNHPLLLLSQFHKTGDRNDLYWLRLHTNGNRMFIILSKQGKIGRRVRKEFLLKNYSVSPVTNPKLTLTADVVFPETEEDDIRDGNFVETKGADITFLNAKKFVIKVKTAETSQDLKCSICAEMMSQRIRECSTGHIFCETCCQLLFNRCPKCHEQIKQWRRNYATESLSVNQRNTDLAASLEDVPCRYKTMGCSFVSRETIQVEQHVKDCDYYQVNCSNYIPDAICSWIGPHKCLVDHFKGTRHGLRVKTVRTTHLVSFGSQCAYFLYIYDRNYFMCTFKTYCHDTSVKITFCHVSTRTECNYEFSVKAVNENKRMVEIFGGPCEAHKMKWSVKALPATDLYSSLNKDKQFQMMVTISRKRF